MRATTRDELLIELDAARTRVMEAIDGLNEEQMSRPGLEGWCVKDHLNHLTACDEFRFLEILRVSRGGRAGFTGFGGEQSDFLNDLIVTQRRRLPLAQVLSDLQAARAFVLEAIAAAPEGALRPERYTMYPVNGGIPHDTGHARAISSWRRREGI
jgi:hypothetical protein